MQLKIKQGIYILQIFNDPTSLRLKAAPLYEEDEPPPSKPISPQANNQSMFKSYFICSVGLCNNVFVGAFYQRA